MKTLFYLLIGLLFYCGYAQPYLPVLEEGNKWSVDVDYCPFTTTPPFNWTVTQQITINGTVDINGITYTQIYRDSDTSCLLREESGIVYKYISNDNTEKILFDFNVEIGDVFFMGDLAYNFDSCAGAGHNLGIWYIEVVEIETLFIAGANRKVITFIDEWYPQGGEVLFWIEGIGTGAGLAIPWAFQDITCGSRLACFETNGISYFMYGATSCDNTTLNSSDFSSEEIVLYPNPVTNRSILQLPAEASVDQIKILDLNGRIIKNEVTSKEYYTIDVMDFRSGLYFYQVFSKGRLIKTDQMIIN